MNLVCLRQHLAIAMLLLALSFSAFGQVNLESVLDPAFNQKLIEKEGIRSISVFADLHEHSLTESGKLVEIEFDERGNRVYKLTSSNGGNAPFIYYGRGSRIEIDSFDVDNNHVLHYTENHFGVVQEYKKFDEKGKVLEHYYLSGKDTMLQYTFVWEKDKMIGLIKTGGNQGNDNVINEFDEKARLVKHISGSRKDLYTYEKVGDSLKTMVKHLRLDTLLYTEIYYKDLKINRLTHYLKKDDIGILVKELKLEYDRKGNATKYYINNPHHRQAYPPTSIVIINTYNSQGLLVKRVFHMSREDVGESILTKVERYFYEKEPLLRKLKKQFFEMDEVEEESIDR